MGCPDGGALSLTEADTVPAGCAADRGQITRLQTPIHIASHSKSTSEAGGVVAWVPAIEYSGLCNLRVAMMNRMQMACMVVYSVVWHQ